MKGMILFVSLVLKRYLIVVKSFGCCPMDETRYNCGDVEEF